MSLERQPDGAATLRLSGPWKLEREIPAMDTVERELQSAPPVRSLRFDTQGVTDWSSGLITFLLRLLEACSQRQIAVDPSGLPQGVRRLVALATAVPERPGVRREADRKPFLAQVGATSLKLWRDGKEMVAFVGEVSLSLSRLARGKARFRTSDLFSFIQQAGAEALPIVSLISVLVGLILAFVGAVQLRLFGAEMYVADLVGIGMIREMGAMMTGILMAGRTGAAYAAQLGTMQVNEEIDAFRTFGIDPLDFLVLPRVIALAIMLPLLCAYADLMGVLGGAIASVGSFDVSIVQYVERTKEAVALQHFWVGISKSAIYGVIVALSGCFRGIQCGRNASAVGEATTSAVVTAIVWIIVSCAVTTVVYQVLGI